MRMQGLRVLSGVLALSTVALGTVAPRAAALGSRHELVKGGVRGSGGTWGRVIRILASGPIEPDGVGGVTSVSCARAGTCVAGGLAGEPSSRPFVATEFDGKWGVPQLVPGIAALEGDGGTGQGGVTGVSCWAVGSCVLVGGYPGGSFVDNSIDGKWQMAIALSGFAVTMPQYLEVQSVSCSADGSCAAGGMYMDDTGTFQPFLVTEARGTWGAPIEVPGSLIAHDGKNSHYAGSEVRAISCSASGDCAAGGEYQMAGAPGVRSGFRVNEVKGVWGDAAPVGGTGSFVESISCIGADNCSLGGSTTFGPFIADEVHGAWTGARGFTVAGDANPHHIGSIAGVSCAEAQECSAVGNVGGSHPKEFVVNEVRGIWQPVIPIPGVNRGVVYSIDCPAPEDCSAAGTFERSSVPRFGGIVVNEVRGVVDPAIVAPGSGDTASVQTAMRVISCSAPGSCAVGGYTGVLNAPTAPPIAVVSSETPGPPPTVTSINPSIGRSTGGTRIWIHGRGFSDALGVRFGASEGTHLIVLNNDELIVSASPGKGLVNVIVETETGSSSPSTASRYKYRSA